MRRRSGETKDFPSLVGHPAVGWLMRGEEVCTPAAASSGRGAVRCLNARQRAPGMAADKWTPDGGSGSCISAGLWPAAERLHTHTRKLSALSSQLPPPP